MAFRAPHAQLPHLPITNNGASSYSSSIQTHFPIRFVCISSFVPRYSSGYFLSHFGRTFTPCQTPLNPVLNATSKTRWANRDLRAFLNSFQIMKFDQLEFHCFGGRGCGPMEEEARVWQWRVTCDSSAFSRDA
jgi:hypothetical protein